MRSVLLVNYLPLFARVLNELADQLDDLRGPDDQLPCRTVGDVAKRVDGPRGYEHSRAGGRGHPGVME